MNKRLPRVSRWAGDLRVIGVVIIAAALVVVYVSYASQNGLPGVPSYNVRLAVPDAGKLIKNSDVRVGGARVGQVLKIQAVPRRGKVPPHAVIDAKLKKDLGPLPADTTAEVRLASVLGGKYVEIVPGHSRRTIPEGGMLGLANARPSVDIEDALSVFDPKGRVSLRQVIGELGDSLAGRGGAINETIGTITTTLPPLQRVLAVLSAQRTGLGRFVRGAAAATTALASVAPELGPLIRNASVTFGALDSAGDSLGQSIEELPPTERAAQSALRPLNPVLDDAAAISRSLLPAATVLPATTRRLHASTRTAIRVDPKIGTLARPLDGTLGAVGAFTRNPASRSALKVLGSTDLATFGASAFVGLGAILQTTADAERHCRVASTWIRRLVDITSEGDSGGNWVRMIPILEGGQMQAQAAPSPNLHANPYPNANAAECEAGNEGYAPGQLIGNPPGLQGGR